MKKIGFLSFGHWTPSSSSQARSAADVLLQSIDLAVEAERLGVDGAYFRVHHFARQLASPFPLLAAVGAKTRHLEIGTAVIDMRYENPHYMTEDAGAADVIAGGRLQLGLSRGSPEQVIDGWRHFGYQPREGEDDAAMGRRHTETFLELLDGKGFAKPNPRPMFPNPPGLLRLEPFSAGLRERIWWGSATNATAVWAAKRGMHLQSSTLKFDESGEPFHVQQAAQIRAYRAAWAEAGHPRSCLGFGAPQATGASLLNAAQIAADEASRHGPGAIRSFSNDMAATRADRNALRDELEHALDEGQIRPHFQPQISTHTGAISGFEALARWYHPDKGLIPPAEFLPMIEDAGLGERMGEVILYHALTALVRWDRAGLNVPTVAVNFSSSELRNPRLAEKLKWEMDRFGIHPKRLCVEVLENVVAQTDNDVIVANIAALAKLGCGIDLDDFGTGHASITSIRRFAVRRIKIDRSFVAKLDEDREQQKMVAAILSMAERLGLETLAEGVETPGEHAMLSQLGCGDVQGFGIARPMPVDETMEWIARHCLKVGAIPRIGSRAR